MERILFLSHNIGYNGGGAERQIVTVACLLKEKGYDVEFLCYCRGSFYENILEEHNIKINWLISSSYIGRMLSIRKFIRKNKYDVVISFQETPNFLNCFAAIGGKKWKVITSERSAKEEFFCTQKPFCNEGSLVNLLTSVYMYVCMCICMCVLTMMGF